MKAINYLFLFVFVLTISVSSCKKDEVATDDNLPSEDKAAQQKEWLTEKSWKISSSNPVNGGVAYTISDCLSDDVFTFSSDGTLSHNVGIVKCDTQETNQSGSWAASYDGNTFSIQGLSPQLIPDQVIVSKDKIVGLVWGDFGEVYELILIPV
jgi:hypothetical protein